MARWVPCHHGPVCAGAPGCSGPAGERGPSGPSGPSAVPGLLQGPARTQYQENPVPWEVFRHWNGLSRESRSLHLRSRSKGLWLWRPAGTAGIGDPIGPFQPPGLGDFGISGSRQSQRGHSPGSRRSVSREGPADGARLSETLRDPGPALRELPARPAGGAGAEEGCQGLGGPAKNGTN